MSGATFGEYPYTISLLLHITMPYTVANSASGNASWYTLGGDSGATNPQIVPAIYAPFSGSLHSVTIAPSGTFSSGTGTFKVTSAYTFGGTTGGAPSFTSSSNTTGSTTVFANGAYTFAVNALIYFTATATSWSQTSGFVDIYAWGYT